MIHCCFAPFGSHRSHRSHWIFLLMVLNLTEVGRWVVERVGVLWVLRVLRFPKTHTNYFCWISLNLCEPKGAKVRRASVRFSVRRAKLWEICVSLREQGCVKHLWDLASGVQNCGICEICVRHKGEAERNILWDLWDFGGIIFCCGQFGVTL